MVIFSTSVFSNEIQSPCYVRWLKMKSTTLLQSLYNVVICHKPIFCVAHPCFVQWAKMYFFGENSTACICDPPWRNESHVAEVDFTGDRKNLITPRILHLHLWNWVDLSSNNSGSFWQDETSDSISEFAF